MHRDIYIQTHVCTQVYTCMHTHIYMYTCREYFVIYIHISVSQLNIYILSTVFKSSISQSKKNHLSLKCTVHHGIVSWLLTGTYITLHNTCVQCTIHHLQNTQGSFTTVVSLVQISTIVEEKFQNTITLFNSLVRTSIMQRRLLQKNKHVQ